MIPWRRAWQLTPVFLPGESPWTEEPGGLRPMGSQRAGHGWATKHRTAEATATDFLPNALKNEEKILFLDFWCLTVCQLASHRTRQREGTIGTSHRLLVPDPRRGFHGLCQLSFNHNTVQSHSRGVGHTAGRMQRQGPLEGCWPQRGPAWGPHCWCGKGVRFSQRENLDSALQRKFFYCAYKALSVIKAQSHQVSLPWTPGPQDPCWRSCGLGRWGACMPEVWSLEHICYKKYIDSQSFPRPTTWSLFKTNLKTSIGTRPLKKYNATMSTSIKSDN